MENIPLKTRIQAAKKILNDADSILICAGAGMSYDPTSGFNPYVSETDFKNHYPGLLKYGYKTSYDTMGLFLDPRIPLTQKWGYQALHIYYMRYFYGPHVGYSTLLNFLKNKDYFVLTSNVDGQFLRSGFDKERIYTPQGDWMYLQCYNRCTDRVWESKSIVEDVLKHVDRSTTTILNPEKIPTCPNCKSTLFGNVRGGDWYVHDHYNDVQNRLILWIDGIQKAKKKLVVLEIGAGFNTPIVTRYPAESIVRETPNSVLIRVNPSEASSHVISVGLGFRPVGLFWMI